MFKICLDPGHNEIGTDTGASYQDLLEQVLTLKIASKVKEGLEAQQGKFTVIMTREGQAVDGPYATLYDSLHTRCQIANNANADLFISIHINAGGGTGSEVLIYGSGGKAEECANIMAPLIADAGAWYNRGVKVQNVQVLRETNMPAILTENGFIDNDQDHAKLQQDAYLQAIADAHVLGICSYFGVQYKTPEESSEKVTSVQSGGKLLPSLIVYFGDVEARIVPYLQEQLKAPAISLGALPLQVIDAADKIYGVGGTADDYVVEGKKIPLYKLIAGGDRLGTASAVIQSIIGGSL